MPVVFNPFTGNLDLIDNTAAAGSDTQVQFNDGGVLGGDGGLVFNKTTNALTGGSFIPTSSTVPTNGVYLPSANNVAISTNSTGRLFVDASGNVAIGNSSANNRLLLYTAGANDSYIQVANGSTGLAVTQGLRIGTPAAGNANIVTDGLLTFGTGNTERLRITSDGKLGLGTSSPAQLLHIKGSGDVKLLLNSTNNASDRGIYFATGTDSEVLGYIKQEYSTGKFEISSGSGSYSSGISFRTGGTEDRVVIDSQGRLGVGTTTPNAKLEIVGGNLRLDNNQGIEWAGSNNYIYGNETTDFIAIATNGSERMRLDSSGRLGLGTSSPTNTLQVGTTASVSSTSPVSISIGGQYVPDASISLSNLKLKVYDSSTDSAGFTIGQNNGLCYVGPLTSSHTWYTADGAGTLTQRMKLDNSGRLGLGTSTPGRLFTVKGSASGNFDAASIQNGQDDGSSDSVSINLGLARTGGLVFEAAKIKAIKEQAFTGVPTTIDAALAFETIRDENTAERMRITSDGKLGLGTSSPSYNLHVKGSSAGEIAVDSASGNDSILRFLENGTSEWSIYHPTGTGDLRFYESGSAARLTLKAGGNVGIGTSSPGAALEVANSGIIRASASGDGTFPQYQVRRTGSTTWTDRNWTTYIALNGSLNIKDETAPADRLTITTAGNVGVGTTTPAKKLHIEDTSGPAQIRITGLTGSSDIYADSNIYFQPNGSTAVTFKSDGKVGVGTTSPSQELHVAGPSEQIIRIQHTSNTDGLDLGNNTTESFISTSDNKPITFYTNNLERAKIDSSGRLLVGTSSDISGGIAGEISQVISSVGGGINLGRNDSTVTVDELLGVVNFYSYGGSTWQKSGSIKCEADAAQGDNDKPGRLVFSTTADGAPSPTERMRITSGGDVLISKDTTSFSTDGIVLADAGYIAITRTSATPLSVIRNGTDGTLVSFEAQNVQEGTISVSGTTVSLNGAHLSRWSQLASGAARIEILRGSVLSNLDEMCEWGEEDNEQLNRMKVSDVEGDKNVSGVFQAWDDDDDTYTNDFYCAMTGDFIIRIGAGVTVERGDLLMSAGDGTAKPQDDDIIRSKTIAKVTSTTVSCTYDDGSYCVPCVLMAC